MARGNQREKAREANLKKQAAMVCGPLSFPCNHRFSRLVPLALKDASKWKVGMEVVVVGVMSRNISAPRNPNERESEKYCLKSVSRRLTPSAEKGQLQVRV